MATMRQTSAPSEGAASSPLRDLFSACTETTLMRDGTTEICCKLGLWGVSGRDRTQLEQEARRYWVQYFQDWEYNELLARTLPT